ncbi:hypothetical protein BH11ACT6_BH11ACT6_58220 [soil metagenome]
MSEIPDQPTRPVVSPAVEIQPTEPERRDADVIVVPEAQRRTSRVVTAAAWVGIVAGTVFVVAVIFFSGFILGKHSDGGGKFGGPGSGRHHEMMFERGFAPGPPMMPDRPGPGMAPGGPGFAGPGNAGPQQPAPPARP